MSLTPYYSRDGITLYVGDNRDVLPHLDGIAAVVTDPPYGLSFMGKDWDHDVPGVAFWGAMREAMTPGAHLLSFGGTRTFHRIAVAIEDAGFEIRDTLSWLYGSGFPKSHDVSKAIESRLTIGKSNSRSLRATEQAGDGEPYQLRGKNNGIMGETREYDRKTFTPATPEAAQWAGWGTALKPAWEPVVLARKPLDGSVAQNVLQHGTGAINVDATRITSEVLPSERRQSNVTSQSRNVDYAGGWTDNTRGDHPDSVRHNSAGRWPANVVLDEEAAALLDAQSGERRTGGQGHSGASLAGYDGGWAKRIPGNYGDTGGASRFFYVAKASRRERNAGLEGMPANDTTRVGQTEWTNRCVSCNASRPQAEATCGRCGGEMRREKRPAPVHANNHPTVKPLALMEWLITLVTPPGGIILDPFAGSGSTLVAAARLGVSAIGIEMSEEYAEIAARRIDHALNERAARLPLEMAAD